MLELTNKLLIKLIHIMIFNKKTLTLPIMFILISVFNFTQPEGDKNDIYYGIFCLIIALIAFLRKNKIEKEKRAGIPENDEFSSIIKYKSGYYGWITAIFVIVLLPILTLFIEDIFVITSIGSFVALFAFFVARFFVKKNYYEK